MVVVSSVEVPEPSSVAGSIAPELLTVRVSPTPMSSSSSSKKRDYSEDDDVDWEDVYPTSDTSKHSHLAEEECRYLL